VSIRFKILRPNVVALHLEADPLEELTGHVEPPAAPGRCPGDSARSGAAHRPWRHRSRTG
jgi:hypothetical protein